MRAHPTAAPVALTVEGLDFFSSLGWVRSRPSRFSKDGAEPHGTVQGDRDTAQRTDASCALLALPASRGRGLMWRRFGEPGTAPGRDTLLSASGGGRKPKRTAGAEARRRTAPGRNRGARCASCRLPECRLACPPGLLTAQSSLTPSRPGRVADTIPGGDSVAARLVFPAARNPAPFPRPGAAGRTPFAAAPSGGSVSCPTWGYVRGRHLQASAYA